MCKILVVFRKHIFLVVFPPDHFPIQLFVFYRSLFLRQIILITLVVKAYEEWGGGVSVGGDTFYSFEKKLLLVRIELLSFEIDRQYSDAGTTKNSNPLTRRAVYPPFVPFRLLAFEVVQGVATVPLVLGACSL